MIAFPTLQSENLSLDITAASQDKFGHYQCNSAMKFAKLLGMNPRDVAQKWIDALDSPLFSHCEVAGPGFINLSINTTYLSQLVTEMVRDPRLGIPLPENPQKIIVEFSSPNVAKEMHVGHLRSTIIGDCLARLFEFLGHNVLRLNHIGDWGTAFGMLIAYMKAHVPQVLEKKESADLSSLMGWYKASKQKFDTEEEFKTIARKEVVALQSGDAEALKAWEMICAISREAYEEVYSLLDIHLKERGESFYNPFLPKIVKDLEEKNLITVSEGAKCVFHEGYKIPLMVQKSDGGYNYDTTDMAAMWHRVFEEKANRIIIITDAGQSLHFQLIYETCVAAGYITPQVKFDHVTFGVVLGPDGKKFKTRSGETEKLMDLLNAAVAEAKKILLDKEPEIEPAECEHRARVLGIDAVKYADLSCNRISDYVFSYERMLRFEGNTAAFILYSYVRVAGIKRKVGIKDVSSLLKEKIELVHPSEVQLGLHLARFSEALEAVSKELFPHYLTDYLYILAQKFNAFFRDCRVEGTKEQTSRLLICEAVAATMHTGLSLLGLQTLERM